MIKIENVEVYGWEAAIRGMRNPMNSWDKSDSCWCCGVMVYGTYHPDEKRKTAEMLWNRRANGE